MTIERMLVGQVDPELLESLARVSGRFLARETAYEEVLDTKEATNINFKREREKQRAAAREGGVVAQTFAESDVVRTWLKRVAVGIKRYDDRDLLDRNTPSGQDLVELTNKIDELDEEQGVKPHKKRP